MRAVILQVQRVEIKYADQVPKPKINKLLKQLYLLREVIMRTISFVHEWSGFRFPFRATCNIDAGGYHTSLSVWNHSDLTRSTAASENSTRTNCLLLCSTDDCEAFKEKNEVTNCNEITLSLYAICIYIDQLKNVSEREELMAILKHILNFKSQHQKKMHSARF